MYSSGDDGYAVPNSMVVPRSGSTTFCGNIMICKDLSNLETSLFHDFIPQPREIKMHYQLEEERKKGENHVPQRLRYLLLACFALVYINEDTIWRKKERKRRWSHHTGLPRGSTTCLSDVFISWPLVVRSPSTCPSSHPFLTSRSSGERAVETSRWASSGLGRFTSETHRPSWVTTKTQSLELEPSTFPRHSNFVQPPGLPQGNFFTFTTNFYRHPNSQSTP